MPLVTTQNLVAGTAEMQGAAAEYSFPTRRRIWNNPNSALLTKPNAPDPVAAEVFGNDPGPSEGVAPPPWTFGGNDMDNLFMLGDFTSQYGPQGMNTISDFHMTMLTSFASVVSKGTTDFGGGAANGISHFMKTHASAHASKSAINKETDGMGVPQTSGGQTRGYNMVNQYGNGPGGEAVDSVPDVAPPNMDSPLQQSFVDASTETSPSSPMFHADKTAPNDGEQVATIAASPGDTPTEASGPELAQSEGASTLNPQASRAGTEKPMELFRRFMSSAAGRSAFIEWRTSDQNQGPGGF